MTPARLETGKMERALIFWPDRGIWLQAAPRGYPATDVVVVPAWKDGEQALVVLVPAYNLEALNTWLAKRCPERLRGIIS